MTGLKPNQLIDSYYSTAGEVERQEVRLQTLETDAKDLQTRIEETSKEIEDSKPEIDEAIHSEVKRRRKLLSNVEKTRRSGNLKQAIDLLDDNERSLGDVADVYIDAGCIGATDFLGNICWEHFYGHSKIKNLIKDEDKVYASVGNYVVAHDLFSGEQLWHSENIPRLDRMFKKKQGLFVYSGKPREVDLLIMLDFSDGKTKWKMETSFMHRFCPAEDYFYMWNRSSGKLLCYNLDDGELIAEQYYDRIMKKLFVSGNSLAVLSADYHRGREVPDDIRLTVFDEGTFKERWAYPNLKSVDENFDYISRTTKLCVAQSDDIVYISTFIRNKREKRIMVDAFSIDKCAHLWTFCRDYEKRGVAFSLYEGKVYRHIDDTLYALDKDTGEIAWEIELLQGCKLTLANGIFTTLPHYTHPKGRPEKFDAITGKILQEDEQ